MLQKLQSCYAETSIGRITSTTTHKFNYVRTRPASPIALLLILAIAHVADPTYMAK